MFNELEIVELTRKCPVLFLEQAVGNFDSEGKQQFRLTFDEHTYFDVGSRLWIDQVSEFGGFNYYMLKPFPGEGVSTQRSMTSVLVEYADEYMKTTGGIIKCFCSHCKEGSGNHDN